MPVRVNTGCFDIGICFWAHKNCCPSFDWLAKNKNSISLKLAFKTKTVSIHLNPTSKWLFFVLYVYMITRLIFEPVQKLSSDIVTLLNEVM